MGVCFLSGFVYLYWELYPYKILILNSPTTVLKSTYHPGDSLTWSVDVTHFTEGIEVHVTREIECLLDDAEGGITHRRYALPETNFITTKGTSTFIQNSFVVPLNAIPNKMCRVIIIGSYHMNPVRDVLFKDFTNSFEII